MEEKKYKKRKIVGNVLRSKNDPDNTYIKLFAMNELTGAPRDEKGCVILSVYDPRRALNPEQLRQLSEEGKTTLQSSREGAKSRTLYDNILFDLYVKLE